MTWLYTLTSSALPDDLHIVAFDGWERLGRPYKFTLYVTATKEVDMAGLMGAKATFSFAAESGEATRFHGQIAGAKLLVQEGELALFRMTLTPRLHFLSLSRHSRVYTEMSVPDVIAEALEEGGLPSDAFRLQLTGSYETEAHISQYQESDLDFIHRWMEFEGIYYFFEQTDDEEVLVITDDKSSHDLLQKKPVQFVAGAEDDDSAGESLWELTCMRKARPAAVRVADYSYDNPSLDLSANADVSDTGFGEVVVHGARFFTPARAQQIATVRAEQLIADEEVTRIEGSARRQSAGYLLEMEGHPIGDFNRKFLVTEAHHFGVDGVPEEWKPLVRTRFDNVYRVHLTCINDDVQYRPARITRWPTVWGFELGVVDGPATSEYAQLDDQGRYKVKLRFDESANKDGKASCLIRMQQPHGGTTEGFHFPLRKGTEVMISFQDGDPDRPVIAQVMPNAQTPSPVTDTNHTTNIIRTGGNNLIEMEDLEGTQRITISTPTEDTFMRMGAPNDDYNIYWHTCGKGCIDVGAWFDWETGGNKHEIVDGEVKEWFKGDKLSEVTEGDTIENYNSTKNETVDLAVTETYSDKFDVTVQNLCQEIYKSDQTTTTTGERKDTVTGAVTEIYTGPMTTHVTEDVKRDYTTTLNLTVGGAQLTQVGGKLTEEVGTFTQTNTDWIQNCWSNFTKIEQGMGIESFIGIKNENLIGGKLETVFGLKLDFFNVVGAISATVTINRDISFNMDVWGPHLKNAGAWVAKQAKAAAVAGAITVCVAGTHLKLPPGP